MERRTENPTVELLDRLAEALAVPFAELFMEPAEGDQPPAPLKGGRRKA